MEIYATIREKVVIDPKDVIEKLIEKEIGSRGWVFEKDGKFYKGYEQSAGSHSFDMEEGITKDKYDYVVALELVLKKLKK